MLLNDKAGRARSEGILVTAQKRSRARFGNAGRDLPRARFSARDIPDPEHKTFAIGHGDHAFRRNIRGARSSLLDDQSHIIRGQLRERGTGQGQGHQAKREIPLPHCCLSNKAGNRRQARTLLRSSLQFHLRILHSVATKSPTTA